jgi:hypothetical protein
VLWFCLRTEGKLSKPKSKYRPQNKLRPRRGKNTFRYWFPKDGLLVSPDTEEERILATEQDVEKYLARPNSRRVHFLSLFHDFAPNIPQEAFARWLHYPSMEGVVSIGAPLSAQTIHDNLNYICSDDRLAFNLSINDDARILSEDIEKLTDCVEKFCQDRSFLSDDFCESRKALLMSKTDLSLFL